MAKANEIDSFHERLLEVQSELKAPKGQENKFGGYRYRSCEDILEAVKPLLQKNLLTLSLSDQVELIGDRYYIMATATVKDTLSDVSLSVHSFAREADEKKGMDVAQVTGSASSYARKYALNGLFLIDDTRDDDTREPTDVGKKPVPKSNAPQNDSQPPRKGRFDVVKALKAEALALGIKEEGIKSYIDATFGKPMTAFTDADVKALEIYLTGLIADKRNIDARSGQ